MTYIFEVNEMIKKASVTAAAYTSTAAASHAANVKARMANKAIYSTSPDTPEYYKAVELAKATYKALNDTVITQAIAAKEAYTAAHNVAKATGTEAAYTTAASLAEILIDAEDLVAKFTAGEPIDAV